MTELGYWMHARRYFFKGSANCGHYLLELQPEVLPKSPSGAAMRYALNQ